MSQTQGFPSNSIAERAQTWSLIDKNPFDILIIGGGITGAGIARDAASRGLKVLVVEKHDYAWGTSSRSSKLIHGGVRYLENLEFKLVQESTLERALLWKLAPQLAKPLAFLFPAYKNSRVPLWKLNIGLWLYDFLARFQVPEIHKKFSAQKLLTLEPALKQEGLTGAIHYFDGATDDALLTLVNILDAQTLGAKALSRAECTAISWNEKTSKSFKEFHSIEIEDKLSSEKKNIRARVVVSAAGPWTDALLAKLVSDSKKASAKLLRPTRGSHLVVSQEKLPLKHAVVMTHPKDGRVLFGIPWGDFTVVGTTDLDDSGNPEQTQMTGEEVDYLLKSALDYFPAHPLTRSDVISTWTGLRPLMAPASDMSESNVSREHYINFIDPGLLVVAGGKLTTFRQMAEECVDRIVSETQKWPTPLTSVLKKTLTKERPLPYIFTPKASSAFIGSTEAARMNLEDVEVILKTQSVFTLEDFMVRRTSIYYKETQNGLKLLPQLKAVFQKVLSWDEEKWQSEVAAYTSYVDHHVTNVLKLN